jgi:flagellar basal-body rod modification protein FlgD
VAVEETSSASLSPWRDDFLYNPDAHKRVANKDLDKNAFLQLFILSLKNQDPTNTQDPNEFMAQMAQFTIMEQLTNMNDSINKMKATQDISQASSLIGRNVKINVAAGLEVEGKVDKVTAYKGEVMVYLENQEGGYDLTKVVEIVR